MTDSNDASPKPGSPEDVFGHRFIGWCALLFCSIISLAAKVSDTWDDGRGKDDWFVIAVSISSIGCSFFSIMGYAISRSNFSGGPIEGLFAVVCLLMWICGMPVIMDPTRNMAVSKGISQTVGDVTVAAGGNVGGAEFTYIRNANIYFFSWASTIAIVYICGRFARQTILRSTHLASHTSLWYLSTLASLVVLVDSVELYMAFDCPDNDPDLCLSSKYAISLGTIGTFLCFIGGVLATCGRLGQWVELLGSILIFGLYMGGVALITFNDGPGTSIGNLYFATWLGVGVTAVMLGRAYKAIIQTFRDKRSAKNKPQKLPDDVDTSKPEEPVVFPDVEMGGDGKTKKDDDDEYEGDPSWAKEDNETHVSASVPPPSKEATSKEEGVKVVEEEINVKPDKAAAKEEKVEDEEQKQEVEVKPKPEPKKTTKPKKRSSSKAKPAKKEPELDKEEDENKRNPFNDDEKDSEPKKEESKQKEESESKEKMKAKESTNKKDEASTKKKQGSTKKKKEDGEAGGKDETGKNDSTAEEQDE